MNSEGPQQAVVIRQAQVVTLDAEQRSGPCDLRMEGGRIVAMGSPASIQTQDGDAEILAPGCVVMPGLVQAHIHLCQTLFRGHADGLVLLDWLRCRLWPMEASLTQDRMRASAQLGIAELLLGGTTSILDMGSVAHTDTLFETAERMGLRYTGGKAIMDKASGQPDALCETPADAMTQSMQLCDRWHGAAGGRLRYAFSPRFVLSCETDTMTACVQEARKRGALLHTHAAENQDEVAQVQAETGLDNIALLHKLGFTGPDVLLAHGVWLTPDERSILKQTQTRIVHCPSSNLKLASGIADVKRLLAEGVPVALGADGAPCNNRLDGFAEMRLAALLQSAGGDPKGLSAERALALATRDGAAALGLSANVGTLEVGKRADLILVDLRQPHTWPPTAELASRLVYAARASDVRLVMVDGQILVQDGTLVRADLDAILDEAEQAAA